MSIIHRHILWQLFKASAAAVGLFTFILITGNAIREILAFLLDGRMNFGLFAYLIALLLPYVISYALPMGVLMGVLLVIGRMCAQSEYTAYRACGVSLNYLARPVWMVSILSVVLLLLVNFYYAPTARASYYTTLAQTIRNDPLRFILPKTFVKEFPGYILYARERDGQTLRDFWIWELDEHNRPLKLVRAREGALKYDPSDDSLTLDLHDGFSELRDTKNPDDLKTVRPTLSFDHANVRLTLNRLLQGEQRGGLTVLTFDKLIRLQKELEAKVNDPKINEEARKSTTGALSQLKFQIQQNFAFAFSVFSLAIVGVPLSIRVSRRETSANLAIALGLALGYYFLIIMTSWLSRVPAVYPELLVWLPNIAFITTGVVMLMRANAK